MLNGKVNSGSVRQNFLVQMKNGWRCVQRTWMQCWNNDMDQRNLLKQTVTAIRQTSRLSWSNFWIIYQDQMELNTQGRDFIFLNFITVKVQIICAVMCSHVTLSSHPFFLFMKHIYNFNNCIQEVPSYQTCFSWFSAVPLGEFWDSTFKQAMATSLYILSNSWFIDHLPFRST